MRYIVRKLASSVVLLVVGTASIFALIFSNSGGIARQILGQNATEEQVAARTEQLGLNEPVLLQYWHWVVGALTGDLGRSFYTGELVTNVLSTRVPVTLALVLISVLLMLLLSVAIGVTAAVKGGWVDRTLQAIGVLGTAVPNFVIAIALVFAFAIAVAIFPATGYVSPADSLGGWAMSLVLPVAAVLIGSVASAAQQFRGATVDVLQQDFVRTLRTRGVRERHIIFRHVLRNAAIPGLTTISLQTIGLMGGVVVIERVFALPGIAAQLNTSAVQGDIPVVMGAVLFTVVVVVVINIVLDLISVWLNPKARTS
jgi:peptide/nickel transport system permease protein